METSSVTSLSSQTGQSVGIASNDLAETFDDFLLLLTTQLQNQDPLSPMDTNEFTDQLVAFTEVEQSIKTNDSLEQLIDLQLTGQLTSAANYIGRTVEAESEFLVLEQGESIITYGLGANSTQTAIQILDESGQVVRSLTGETAAGLHQLTWDGKDDAGNDMPEGIYRIQAGALDANGNAVPIATGTFGRITSVEIADGQTVLSLNGLKIPIDKVVSVTESAAQPTS